jgi:hypothetical protein
MADCADENAFGCGCDAWLLLHEIGRDSVRELVVDLPK